MRSTTRSACPYTVVEGGEDSDEREDATAVLAAVASMELRLLDGVVPTDRDRFIPASLTLTPTSAWEARRYDGTSSRDGLRCPDAGEILMASTAAVRLTPDSGGIYTGETRVFVDGDGELYLKATARFRCSTSIRGDHRHADGQQLRSEGGIGRHRRPVVGASGLWRREPRGTLEGGLGVSSGDGGCGGAGYEWVQVP